MCRMCNKVLHGFLTSLAPTNSFGKSATILSSITDADIFPCKYKSKLFCNTSNVNSVDFLFPVLLLASMIACNGSEIVVMVSDANKIL